MGPLLFFFFCCCCMFSFHFAHSIEPTRPVETAQQQTPPQYPSKGQGSSSKLIPVARSLLLSFERNLPCVKFVPPMPRTRNIWHQPVITRPYPFFFDCFHTKFISTRLKLFDKIVAFLRRQSHSINNSQLCSGYDFHFFVF